MKSPKLKPGSNKSRCAACGEYFGGVTAFDIHRVDPYLDRSCMPQSVMSERGLHKNSRGIWVRQYGDNRKCALYPVRPTTKAPIPENVFDYYQVTGTECAFYLHSRPQEGYLNDLLSPVQYEKKFTERLVSA